MLLNGHWKNTDKGHVARAERDDDGMYDVAWLLMGGCSTVSRTDKYTPAELRRMIQNFGLKKEAET